MLGFSREQAKVLEEAYDHLIKIMNKGTVLLDDAMADIENMFRLDYRETQALRRTYEIDNPTAQKSIEGDRG